MGYVVARFPPRLRTRSVFPAMSVATAPADDAGMPKYLVEVHMGNAGELELERAMRLLGAAQVRMQGRATLGRAIMAGLSPEDDRLVCLVEATNLDAARRLLSLALLPPGRIREITHLEGSELLGGGDPGGDVHPGAESELVEDVVDVGLDGPLRQE
jgi:hypothetical protein